MAAAVNFESLLAGQSSAFSSLENLSYSQALLNGSQYYLLFSNQTPIAIFSLQGQKIPLLRTQAQILPVLLAYYNLGDAQGQALSALSQGHASILQFQSAAAGQGVADCRRITGTDTHACDNYEDCRFACYSVTSYCYPIALGSGKSFIDEIWAYTNNTAYMGSAIAAEQAAYSAASSSPNNQTFSAYLRAFWNASRIANELENSVIVNWICPSQGFDLVAMSRASDSLEHASLSLQSYEALSAHAGAMEKFANSLPRSSPLIMAAFPPALSVLSPQENGVSSCQIRAQHFITSGNITSIVTTKLDTIGECNLSSFGLREYIPENFSATVNASRFSIPPLSLEGRYAYWEFDSLQDGQVLVLTYSTDGWVGYSRIKHFNSTTIYLLPSKPLLQNSAIVPVNSSMLSEAIMKAKEKSNATNAGASQNNSSAANSTASPENPSAQPNAIAAQGNSSAQQSAFPDVQGILSNTPLLLGAGALALTALVAAYFLFIRKGNRASL
ncbi:Uncharacterised protein [Candidatus Anstonella stagnisolia]|nr:Uncharacterised protein [Candidatus Anstonella stagnisolia]